MKLTQISTEQCFYFISHFGLDVRNTVDPDGTNTKGQRGTMHTSPKVQRPTRARGTVREGDTQSSFAKEIPESQRLAHAPSAAPTGSGPPRMVR